MSRMMGQAAVAMNQLQQQLDVIGHNLANSQTTGYKTRRADFQSLLFQHINNLSDPRNSEGRVTPEGIRVGSGAKVGKINAQLTPGTITNTDRELDVALLDDDYLFQVEVTDGNITETRYTRDGSFYLSPINNDTELMLTTADGHPVLGEDGHIIVPDTFDSIRIDDAGRVIVQQDQVSTTVGTIEAVEAIRPRELETVGENFFRLPDVEALGYEADEIIESRAGVAGFLRSGALEHSNVDLAQQMSDMLVAQRSYQMNARTVTMSDQMTGLINQLR